MNLYSNISIKKEYRSYLQKKIGALDESLALSVYLIGDNSASVKYIQMKQKWAESLGIKVILRRFESSDLRKAENQLRLDADDESIQGIIVQLPLTADFMNILEYIPVHKDVDLLNKLNSQNNNILLLQPTVQAIVVILNDILFGNSITFEKKLLPNSYYNNLKFVVIGQGKLVGMPISEFLNRFKCNFSIIDINTPNPAEICKTGDVVICGAGSPNLVDERWLKKNVIAIDASTSNDNGQLVGDINPLIDFDPSITIVPSPGGIGPLTVYSLFMNLIRLATSEKF